MSRSAIETQHTNRTHNNHVHHGVGSTGIPLIFAAGHAVGNYYGQLAMGNLSASAWCHANNFFNVPNDSSPATSTSTSSPSSMSSPPLVNHKNWPELTNALSLLPFLHRGAVGAIGNPATTAMNAWSAAAAAAAYANLLPTASMTGPLSGSGSDSGPIQSERIQINGAIQNNLLASSSSNGMLISPLNLKQGKFECFIILL